MVRALDAMMNSSSEFQTGGIVLLAVSIVFCGLAAAALLPLINGKNGPPPAPLAISAAQSSELTIRAGEEFSEFYPPSVHSANEQLQRSRSVNVVTKPSPSIAKNPAFAPKTFAVVQPPAVAELHNPLATTPPSETMVQPTPDWMLSPSPFAVDTSSQPSTGQTDNALAQRSKTVIANAPVSNPPKATAPVLNTPEAAVPVVNAPAVNTGNEGQIPAAINPRQMPPGSVYAPVTIHPVTVQVDGSLFAEQLKTISDRVDTFIAANERTSDQNTVLRRQQKAHRNKSRALETRDEEIEKLGESLDQLAKSIQELKVDTHQSLKQVTRQADRTAVASQVIESYRRALEDERLTQSPRPATQIASRPAATFSDTPAVPAEIPVSKPPEATIPTLVPWRVEAVMPKSAPVTLPVPEKPSLENPSLEKPSLEKPSLEKPSDWVPPPVLVKPVEVPAETSAKTVFKTPFLPIAEHQPPSRPVFSEPQPEITAPVSVDVLPKPVVSDDVILDLEERPIPERSGKASTPTSSLDLQNPKTFTPLTGEMDDDAVLLDPFPPRRMVSPVGFENVYRFKMAEADDGQAEVVPAGGNVCQNCGKVHAVGTPHTRSVSSTKSSAGTASQPNNRQGARRSIRKINETRTRPATTGDSPQAPASPGSQQPTEPSVLHRMSSVLKSVGRSLR
nr:hypothetical protein [uncultured bacterium]